MTRVSLEEYSELYASEHGFNHQVVKTPYFIFDNYWFALAFYLNGNPYDYTVPVETIYDDQS